MERVVIGVALVEASWSPSVPWSPGTGQGEEVERVVTGAGARGGPLEPISSVVSRDGAG